jgi:hypothetical protein
MDVALVEPLPILAFKSPEIMSANEYLENTKFRRLSSYWTTWSIRMHILEKMYMIKPRLALLTLKCYEIYGWSFHSFSNCHLCVDHCVINFHDSVSPLSVQQFHEVVRDEEEQLNYVIESRSSKIHLPLHHYTVITSHNSNFRKPSPGGQSESSIFLLNLAPFC